MSYEHLLDPTLQGSIDRAIGEFARLQQFSEDFPAQRIREEAFTFDHTPQPAAPFQVAASDGSGSFPLISRDTIFFYFVTADALTYQADGGLNPLRRTGEVEQFSEVLVWAEHWDDATKADWLDDYYQRLTGMTFRQLAEASDYLELKQEYAERPVPTTVKALRPILYSASEVDSVRKLLMGSAELAALLRVLRRPAPPDLVLMDGTLSLPSISRRETILTNVLKRHLVTQAREQGVCAIALSKSSTFVGATEIAQLLTQHFDGTHWAYRFPIAGEEPLGIEGLNLPPPGAVTYLVRFHRETPALRLDFDSRYWQAQGGDDWVKTILPQLDFCSHEARCFGYPYPLFAAHVRCSTTQDVQRAAKSRIFSGLRNAGFDPTEFEDIHTLLGMGDW